ncbi:hypothetical protein E4U32_000754 [Claviceps aff. humidiphila group G2b]|nr:hypothetical protein E4U32_000754 [Claviceps aff. humidiphila group G2b]
MLNVIIAGAGIAGLSAAIALRRAGHDVHIYEKSSLNSETGAAIIIAPNSVRFLMAWGLDPVRWRWVLARRSDRLDPATLQTVRQLSDEKSDTAMGGVPTWLSHRVDLHSALKWMATREDGPGRPVVIHTGSGVRSYNSSKPSIVLENGDEICGHLVIAADGIHSAGPEAILGRKNTPVSAVRGNCCYRFLIPVERLEEDPDTRFFVGNHHGWTRILADKDRVRRLVTYPCRDNTVLNFVGVLDEKDEDLKQDHGPTKRENWHEPIDIAQVLDKYAGFDPRLLKVMSKGTNVRKWPLLYRRPLPAWNKGCMTLAGDAAHPILPHLGQGGAQALEDGLTLGIIFSGASSSPRDIQDRLALYFQARHKRASVVQIISNVGADQPNLVAEELLQHMTPDEIPKDFASSMRFCLAYDLVQTTVDTMKEYDPRFELAEGFFERPVVDVPKALA